MTMSPKTSLITAASFWMLILMANTDSSKDKQECAESLVGLATCLPYVGGTAKSPTPDCCSGLKQVLNTNKKCLCVVIKNRNDPDWGLTINATLALTLPDVCHAPANVSQCPALLNLAPNSPDAQVFYQLRKNSTHEAASSPVTAKLPNSTSGAVVGSHSQPKTDGPELILIGLIISSLSIFYL